MKTIYNSQNNLTVTSMDDIIFAGRNQAYGAFYLRKNYNKFLIRSFLFTSTLVASIFIFSIANRTKVIPVIAQGPFIVDPFPYTPKPLVPPAPPGPAGPSKAIKDILIPHPPIVGTFSDNDPQLPINEDFAKSMGQTSESGREEGLSMFPTGGNGGGGDIIPDDTTTHMWPEEPASFNNKDFSKWVAEHVTYPEDIQHMGIQGKVLFQFVVNKQGYTEAVNILRGVDPALDQEVIKTIMNSPKWIPGKQGGYPVKERFTMQIYFKIDR